MVDASDSKSDIRESVKVQVLSPVVVRSSCYFFLEIDLVLHQIRFFTLS